jgi:hypothetical protein
MADRYKVLKFPDCCSEEDVAQTLNTWSKEYGYSVITSWYQHGRNPAAYPEDLGRGVVIMELDKLK